MKCYTAISRAIESEGIEAIFAVMGDGNMLVLSELQEHGMIPVYYARHESAAMAMADGYARASGKTGMCAITQGPGITTLLTSLVTASRGGVPIVVFAGDTPSTGPGIQRINQERVVTAGEAVWAPLRSPATAIDDVSEAFQLAHRLRRPVVLDAPEDVQQQDYPWEFEAKPSRLSAGTPQRIQPDPEVVEEMVRRLRASSRPVVLAGRGAMDEQARQAALRLGDRIGALMATTLPAKGLFAGEAYDVGIAGQFCSEEGQTLLGEADLVLAAGATLNYFTTEGSYLFPTADVLRIDRVPYAPSPGGLAADVYLQADAAAGLGALERALDGAGHRSPGFRDRPMLGIRGNLPSSGAGGEAGEGLDPRQVVAAVDEAMPADARVVVGSGHFMSFPIMGLSGARRLPYVFTYDFGSIGQGLSAGIGAAVADGGRPVVCFEGDSSLMMHLADIHTAARYCLNLLIVLMNDGGLGAEFHKLRAKGRPPETSLMQNPDLAAVSAALGAAGASIDDLGDLQRAIEKFASDGGPMLLDVRISRAFVSDPYRRLYFPETAGTP